MRTVNYDFRFSPLPAVWPTKPTAWPTSSKFKAPYSDTVRLLNRELSYLDARRPVIQAGFRECDIRMDGLPRAGCNKPTRPGVILSFESKHGPLSYPCDTFNDWESNLRAIALALEHLRAVDRYGVTRRGEQYQGWKALPPPSSPAPNGTLTMTHLEARQFLQRLAPDVNLAQDGGLQTAYRQAAMKAHPDRGGDPETFKRLQEAKAALGL